MARVGDMMQKKFLYLEADDTIASAADTLLSHKVAAAPVMRRGKFAGMISVSEIAGALVVRKPFKAPELVDVKSYKNETVLKHMKPFDTILKEDDDMLRAYLAAINSRVECIPVVNDKRKMVGVILASDLIEEMARRIEGKSKVQEKKESNVRDTKLENTMIDQVLHFVKEKGSVTSDDVAKKFNLPVSEVEEYAACLEKNKFMKIEYSMFGKTKLIASE